MTYILFVDEWTAMVHGPQIMACEVVKSTIQLYEDMSAEMLPTPAKSISGHGWNGGAVTRFPPQTNAGRTDRIGEFGWECWDNQREWAPDSPDVLVEKAVQLWWLSGGVDVSWKRPHHSAIPQVITPSTCAIWRRQMVCGLRFSRLYLVFVLCLCSLCLSFTSAFSEGFNSAVARVASASYAHHYNVIKPKWLHRQCWISTTLGAGALVLPGPFGHLPLPKEIDGTSRWLGKAAPWNFELAKLTWLLEGAFSNNRLIELDVGTEIIVHCFSPFYPYHWHCSRSPSYTAWYPRCSCWPCLQVLGTWSPSCLLWSLGDQRGPASLTQSRSART